MLRSVKELRQSLNPACNIGASRVSTFGQFGQALGQGLWTKRGQPKRKNCPAEDKSEKKRFSISECYFKNKKKKKSKYTIPATLREGVSERDHPRPRSRPAQENRMKLGHRSIHLKPRVTVLLPCCKYPEKG